MSTNKTLRVALYGRVSHEKHDQSKSVDDQLAELRRWADRENWEIVEVFRDDGISASRYANGKARPGWQQVMDLLASGRIDALLVWEISRASRDRPVFAVLFAGCADADVKIGTNGRLHDLADADDGFTLDLGAALAVRESAHTSKRVRRAINARAAEGRPHGTVPFGYRRVIDPNTGRTLGREKDPVSGPIFREIVDRLLAREPAHAIASDLNDRGITTNAGARWTGGNLSRMVLRPSYAALRVHQGVVLADVRGNWPPLVTEQEHHQLLAMYGDPARDRWRTPKVARYLGSGIYRCGREGCEGRMRVATTEHRVKKYDCRNCHRVSRNQKAVDERIVELLMRRLERDDVLALLGSNDDPEARHAAAEAARLKGKLRAARQAWEDDLLSLESVSDMEARLLPKIRRAEERARPKHLPPALLRIAGPEVRAEWSQLAIREQRAVLAAMLDVTILPIPAGADHTKFDIRFVDIRFRGQDR